MTARLIDTRQARYLAERDIVVVSDGPANRDMVVTSVYHDTRNGTVEVNLVDPADRSVTRWFTFPADDVAIVVDTCPWHVLVATGHPEPDSWADTVREVACGARLVRHDADGWECADGHEHLTYGSPAQQAQEAEEALLDRLRMRD